MMVKMLSIDAVEITDIVGLDPIQVFWNALEIGRGSVVITCYGCAWTAYWGAMGNLTIQQFFLSADIGYLVSKLGITPLLKQRKCDLAYLGRIVEAIKESIVV